MENTDYFTPEAALKMGEVVRCDEKPPFWYPCCQIKERKPGPVGNLDDLAYLKPIMPIEKKEWLREMGVDKKEMYLPGEIYKKRVTKEYVNLPKTQESCQGVWTAKTPGFYDEIKVEDYIPITYPLYERVMLREKLSIYDVPKGQTCQGESSAQNIHVRSAAENLTTPSRVKEVPKTKKIISCVYCGDRECKEHVHIPGTNPCCRRYTVDRK